MLPLISAVFNSLARQCARQCRPGGPALAGTRVEFYFTKQRTRSAAAGSLRNKHNQHNRNNRTIPGSLSKFQNCSLSFTIDRYSRAQRRTAPCSLDLTASTPAAYVKHAPISLSFFCNLPHTKLRTGTQDSVHRDPDCRIPVAHRTEHQLQLINNFFFLLCLQQLFLLTAQFNGTRPIIRPAIGLI